MVDVAGSLQLLIDCFARRRWSTRYSRTPLLAFWTFFKPKSTGSRLSTKATTNKTTLRPGVIHIGTDARANDRRQGVDNCGRGQRQEAAAVFWQPDWLHYCSDTRFLPSDQQVSLAGGA